jgi:hypothetical protein
MVRSVMQKAVVLTLLLGPISAPAQAEPAGRLLYDRGPGAEACPDEATLRRAVAARLGEDPFDSRLSRTFRLTIAMAGARLRGVVELVTEGLAEGRRELDAEPGACAELVDAMALAVSLTINPDLVVEVPRELPSPSPPAAPELQPTTEPERRFALPRARPSRDAPRASREKAPPLALEVGGLAHGAVGTGPGVAAGGTALIRAGTPTWGIGIEGRLDALSRAGIGRSGTVRSTLTAGVLAPCARFGHGSACPLLLMGSLFARSQGVTTERSDRGFYAAAGARLAVGAPLADQLLLEARLDALYPLTRVTIDLDGIPVWRASASGALGVGVIWEIP